LTSNFAPGLGLSFLSNKIPLIQEALISLHGYWQFATEKELSSKQKSCFWEIVEKLLSTEDLLWGMWFLVFELTDQFCLIKHHHNSDGSGSENFYPGHVESIFLLGSGWVSHLWFGFGTFPLKIPKFSIFALQVWSQSTRVKGGFTSYLLHVKSMLRLGQAPSLL